jgi:hypothetical protein
VLEYFTYDESLRRCTLYIINSKNYGDVATLTWQRKRDVFPELPLVSVSPSISIPSTLETTHVSLSRQRGNITVTYIHTDTHLIRWWRNTRKKESYPFPKIQYSKDCTAIVPFRNNGNACRTLFILHAAQRSRRSCRSSTAELWNQQERHYAM